MNQREIKFRAKSGEDGSWEYFDLLKHHEVMSLSERIQRGWITGLDQFTGLKDKNGKEIYSGDLLKYNNSDKKFEVKWADEGFWECDGSCLGRVLREIEMEVVGNIYEG